MTKEQLEVLRLSTKEGYYYDNYPSITDVVAHIDEQQREIEMLQGSLEEWRLDFAGLKEDNARLRGVIKKHKSEVWGRVEVSHPDDADLYDALKEASDD